MKFKQQLIKKVILLQILTLDSLSNSQLTLGIVQVTNMVILMYIIQLLLLILKQENLQKTQTGTGITLMVIQQLTPTYNSEIQYLETLLIGLIMSSGMELELSVQFLLLQELIFTIINQTSGYMLMLITYQDTINMYLVMEILIMVIETTGVKVV